ncbi:MAG: glycosyltransferase family 2 protein [Bacteroidales bacterium]|nr:glycosyltransferase family 2 protein [Bacteroidales bacterium]
MNHHDIEISVIIPVYNEEKHIGKCLISLLKQDYPLEKVEFIFVDGMSEDSTVEIIERYESDFANLKILTNEHRTVPYAMNKGIEESLGKYIIRLDGHSEYSNDYFSLCVKYLEKTGADNVGGLAIAKSQGYIGNAISAVLSSKFGVGNSTFRVGGKEGYVDTVPFGAYRRETFEKYGLYDERLARNQDIELNYRIRQGGGKVFFTPEIQLSYLNRDNLREFTKQNYQNGKWNIITWKLCPGSLSLRHFVPLSFVLSIIFLFTLALLTGHNIFRNLLLIELGLYFTLNICSSIVGAHKHDVLLFPLVFLAFLVLHLSYGIGSLAGLSKLVTKKI